MSHRSAFGPSNWYYVLALALMAVTYFSLGLFLDRRLDAISGDLTYTPAPGEVTVAVPAPGHYSIYVEYQGILDNELFVTAEELGDLECTVSGPDGGALALHQPLWPVRYTRGSRFGKTVLDFHASAAGSHVVAAAYPEGTAGPRLLLAVGEGLLGTLSADVLGGLALALSPALAGIVVWVIVWRLRLKARRRLYGRHP